MTDREFQLERDLADMKYRLSIEKDKVRLLEDKIILLNHKINTKNETLKYVKQMLDESLERERIGHKIIADMRKNTR